MSSKHSETTNEAIELAMRSTDGAIHIETSMSVPADGAQEKKTEMKPSQDRQIIYIIYISAAAILGACLRVYMDRFFGGDCEDDSVNDFLTPVSSHICLTSSGRTLQTGGALFRDLPANILGSFIMGLVSSKAIRIPWLRKDHPLQKDDVYHVMISTGFCGSLTTFASWNTQMVAMMDGTHCELGSQVLVAIFGYLFGFMLAISGFQFGRQVAALMYSWKHRDDSETAADEEVASDEQILLCRSFFRPKLLILVPAFILIALFVVGDVVHEIQFYRNMILMWLVAPFGASIRWKLSKWNSPNNRSVCLVRLNWVPVGTLAANLVGAICSIVCTGLLDRANYEEQTLDPWVLAILFAVKTGFAGSLSTVSSMVKEVVFLSEEHPAQIKSHMYAVITCVCAMATGLIIYAPIARTT